MDDESSTSDEPSADDAAVEPSTGKDEASGKVEAADEAAPSAEEGAPGDLASIEERTRWAKEKEAAGSHVLEAALETQFLKSPERATVFAVASRARMFGILSFVVAALQVVLSILSLVRKVEGTAAYMLPSAALNVALGVFLLRVSSSFSSVRAAPEPGIVDGFESLSTAILVQLFAVGIVILGLTVSLLLAVISNRALNQ
jgi:hypothetical protein